MMVPVRPGVLVIVVVCAWLMAGEATAAPIQVFGESWSDTGEAPDAAVHASAGEVHLAYKSGAVRYAVFDAGGNLLSNVSEGWNGAGNGWTYGPGLAVAGNGTRHLAWAVDLGGWMMDGRYATWAGSWSAAQTVQPSTERGYSPQMAADGQGATVVFQELQGNSGWVNAYRIEDGDLVGTATQVLSARADDRLDIVAGPGPGERHLFAGLPNPSGNILYAHSTDGGQGWTGLGNIEAEPCGARVGQPDAALGPNSAVHLVYGCGSDGDLGDTPSVRYARIDGTSVAFDTPITSSGELQEWHLSLGIGRIAVTAGGSIVVVYLTKDTGALYLTSSDDGGVSWHAPQKIANKGGDAEGRNTPAVVALGDTIFVAYSDGGTVHLVRGEAAGCEPDCIDKTCGPDGCGGSCGSCAVSEKCGDGQCHCDADCQAPVFTDLPALVLSQGKSDPRALDLRDFVVDPDTEPSQLAFSVLEPGPVAAGISIVDGHHLAVLPQDNWVGTAPLTFHVTDGVQTGTGTTELTVTPAIPPTPYAAPRLEDVTIDGDLSEWSQVPAVSLAAPDDWAGLEGAPPGPPDLSAAFRIAWHDGILYVAVEVTDDVHELEHDAEMLWQGDGVQVGVDGAGDHDGPGYDGNDWEVGAGLVGGATPASFCWHTPEQAVGCPVGAAVIRAGTGTVYELEISGAFASTIGFSLLVNDADGGGRHGWLEWTPGISQAKDPSLFGTVELAEDLPPTDGIGGDLPGPEPEPSMDALFGVDSSGFTVEIGGDLAVTKSGGTCAATSRSAPGTFLFLLLLTVALILRSRSDVSCNR